MNKDILDNLDARDSDTTHSWETPKGFWLKTYINTYNIHSHNQTAAPDKIPLGLINISFLFQHTA